MPRFVVAFTLGLVVALAAVAPAFAAAGDSTVFGIEQQGCDIAVVRTAGTPGATFVQAACARALSAVGAATVPPLPVPIPLSPAAGVKYGCGIAIAQSAGTPGSAFVKAGCAQALAAVEAAPAPVLIHAPAR